MNSRLNIQRKAVLWLGLCAALVAGGFLLVHRELNGDLPAPKPAPMQTRVTSENGAQPVQSVSRLPAARELTEPVPDRIKTMKSGAVETGYEMPFSDTTNPVSKNMTAIEPGPAKLSAQLTGAAETGNIRELSALLNSGSPSSEIEAVRLLARIGGGDALAAALGKVLTVPVDNPDYDKFIKAFADCRSAAVAEWLTGFLGQTQTDDVRQRVLTILAALHGPEVIDSLAAGLAHPADQRHAGDCAELLAKSSDPAQATVLRDLIETGKSTEIQTAAARGLANVGSGEACAALVEIGSSTESTAAACRDALATVDSSYGQEALIAAAVNPAVPSAVRCAAIQALSAQPGQRVQTVLANLEPATSDPALQTAIDQALQTSKQSGTPPQSGGTAGAAGINGEIGF